MGRPTDQMPKSTLRRMFFSWFVMILIIMALAAGIGIVVGQKLINEYDILLQDNVICYHAQEALALEIDAFEDHVRENSQSSLQLYREACADTRRRLDALPMDYGRIGEDRYARTWNLLNGYEGYAAQRDAFDRADPNDPGYVDEMYRIMRLQGHLSDSALRMVQATVSESNRLYELRSRVMWMIPVFFVTILLLALGIDVVILRQISRNVAIPLIRLSGASRKIAENDFSGEDVRVDSTGEVGELVESFNRMKHAMAEHLVTLDELHQQELAKVELERDLDQAKLEMLKSQVDPHFLFNTLNMISCMARMEDAGTTDRMIVSLANLFRYNLRTKQQEVYLEQELEALDDYLYIQQMRFGSRVTCRKIILADPKNVKIPSFSLQPVVENAFTHGLKTKLSGGRLTLRIWQEGNMLIVSIADNGVGMDEEQLEALSRSIHASEETGKGIGLGNIHRRVGMLYPDGSMHIYSRKNRGTVVQFRIPQTNTPKEEIG